MREVFKNQHQALWVQALEAKFEGKGHTWQREDFEQILAGYQVRDRPGPLQPPASILYLASSLQPPAPSLQEENKTGRITECKC